jgi:hypothetical protein
LREQIFVLSCAKVGEADSSARAAGTVSRFHGIVIAMFFDDHGHPHFHARHADAEAKVRIDN